MVIEKEYPELMSMEEAMEFLSEHNIPCRSRRSFYKRLKDLKIPYTVLNPGGRKLTRRFRKSDLEKVIHDIEYFVRKEKDQQGE